MITGSTALIVSRLLLLYIIFVGLKKKKDKRKEEVNNKKKEISNRKGRNVITGVFVMHGYMTKWCHLINAVR